MNNNALAAIVIGAIVVLGIVAFVIYNSSNDTTETTTTTVIPVAGTQPGTPSTVTTTTTTSSTTVVNTPLPPLATTGAASRVTASSTALNGSVNPRGGATTYWFEYSSDSLLGAVLTRSTTKATIAADRGLTGVTANVSGLSRSTKYYYRIVAENSQGTIRGETLSFTTN